MAEWSNAPDSNSGLPPHRPAAAVRGGVAAATTLGFSPLECLMMGTRSGSVDPGILLHLQREHGLTIKELDRALNHSSGLLGISGVSSDLAQIEIAASQGNERARLAFDMFDSSCSKLDQAN